MLPFRSLIVYDKEGPIPVYKQITNRLIGLIQDGTLQPSAFLPGTRQMAELLQVNRKTVINAYDELITQEWIESLSRKGYRVIPDLPFIKPRSFHPKRHFHPVYNNSKDRSVVQLQAEPASRRITSADIVVNDGYPDMELAPLKELSKVYRDQTVSGRIKQLMSIGDKAGLCLLRDTTSVFLNETRGLNVLKDQRRFA